MFLLDTNVVSEMRLGPLGRADARVLAWVGTQPSEALYLSTVTIFELEFGVLRLDRGDPAQASALRTWLEDQVLPAFDGRILPVDTAVARRTTRLHVPEPLPERDGQIAATALVHGLTVVTRNVADFARTGVQLHDPWAG